MELLGGLRRTANKCQLSLIAPCVVHCHVSIGEDTIRSRARARYDKEQALREAVPATLNGPARALPGAGTQTCIRTRLQGQASAGEVRWRRQHGRSRLSGTQKEYEAGTGRPGTGRLPRWMSCSSTTTNAAALRRLTPRSLGLPGKASVRS